MNRHTITISLTLCLAACHGSAPLEAKPPVARVTCVAVSEQAVHDELTLQGVVASPPETSAIVSAQISGRLEAVLVREGDVVKRGQVLARVEATPQRDIVRQMNAQRAQALAVSKLSQATLTREDHLFDEGISARQAVETARATGAQNEALLAAANAQADVAQLNLQRTLIRAPFDGAIVRTFRHAGELVDGTAATPILELADPHSLELVAGAGPEALMALELGQEATVTFAAMKSVSAAAQVRSIAPAVDAMTGLGVVRLTLGTSLRIPLGVLGTASVRVGTSHRSMLVPAAAIRNAGGTSLELIECVDGHAHPLTITIGRRIEDRVEVLSPRLDAGARVVVEGLIGLVDGLAIKESP